MRGKKAAPAASVSFEKTEEELLQNTDEEVSESENMETEETENILEKQDDEETTSKKSSQTSKSRTRIRTRSSQPEDEEEEILEQESEKEEEEIVVKKSHSRSKGKGKGKSSSRSHSSHSQPSTSRRDERDRSMNNCELLAQLTDYMDSKIDDLKQEMAAENAAMAEKLEKRKVPREFRSKSCQWQWEVNQDILEKVESAKKELNRSTPRVSRAESKLEEGIDLLNDRNKMIIIADTTEGGWATVAEYCQKDIPSDSEDDRRIKKADVSALKKKQQKRKPQQKKPYWNNWNNNDRNNRNNFRQNNRRDYDRPYYPQENYGQRTTASKKFLSTHRLCFGCGSSRHYRRDCPLTDREDSADYNYDSKLSIHFDQVRNNDLNECVDSENRPQCSDEQYINVDEACDYIMHNADMFDYEKCKTTLSVKGRLKKDIKFWQDINSNSYILDVIENGYRIPFLTEPKGAELKNNKSALNNDKFVQNAINELLVEGKIEEISRKPYIINPLTVAENKSKKRLVLDLRHVNPFVWKEHMKFEDWRVAIDYVTRDTMFVDFDLSSGYHHIDIHEDCKKYLGFKWNFEGKDRYFQFTVLPFGLSTAGYIFSKTLRCIIKHWRGLGIKIIMFLDDGLILSNDFDEMILFRNIVRRDLIDSGLVSNEEKSHWEPSYLVTWLGVSLNSQEGVLYIPERRVNSLREALKIMTKKKVATARQLASVAGKIVSTYIVVGNVVRLMTKHCHMNIMTRLNSDTFFKLDESVLTELNFWLENFDALNSRVLFESKTANRVVFSDASNTGCGGYVVDIRGSVCYRKWIGDEASQSSTWRELMGVLTVLEAIPHVLANKVLKWYSDNQNVIRIIQGGSMKECLQSAALDIYRFTLRNHITLQMEWLPRGQNQVADDISKIIDYDDWQITFDFFRFIEESWGKHDVDWFASYGNHKTERFYAKYYTPGCEGVDALAFNWSHGRGWLVPPPCLILKCINKLVFDRCRATLIVPYWKSAIYWPALVDSDGNFRRFVIDNIIVYEGAKVLVRGTVKSIFGAEFKGAMIALNINACD